MDSGANRVNRFFNDLIENDVPVQIPSFPSHDRSAKPINELLEKTKKVAIIQSKFGLGIHEIPSGLRVPDVDSRILKNQGRKAKTAHDTTGKIFKRCFLVDLLDSLSPLQRAESTIRVKTINHP
jgi:hypothetical protein